MSNNTFTFYETTKRWVYESLSKHRIKVTVNDYLEQRTMLQTSHLDTLQQKKQRLIS